MIDDVVVIVVCPFMLAVMVGLLQCLLLLYLPQNSGLPSISGMI
jgi:hypothetical protein